jgi:hypothetical protein
LTAVEWFNGSPEQGQNVGIVYGDLAFTTIDSLGWNGAPFSWTDLEEADIACAGPLATSDVCMGLRLKITGHEIYNVLIILNLICLVPAMVFTSWVVHQLRFGMIVSSNDSAHVGYWGCVTENTSLWRDPCLYVLLHVICFVPGIFVGLPAWPISMLLLRNKFIGLGGLWWGGAQTIFGVPGVVFMGPAYEMYVTAAVFFVPISAFLTLKMRNAHRALVYGGGVDATDDITNNASSLFTGGFSRIGGGLTGMLSYVPTFSWGTPAPPAEQGGSAAAGAGAGAVAGGAGSSSSPPKYTSSTVSAGMVGQQQQQQLPNHVPEDSFGSPFGESSLDGMDYGSGKGQGQQAGRAVEDDFPQDNAFAPSKSMSY